MFWAISEASFFPLLQHSPSVCFFPPKPKSFTSSTFSFSLIPHFHHHCKLPLPFVFSNSSSTEATITIFNLKLSFLSVSGSCNLFQFWVLLGGSGCASASSFPMTAECKNGSFPYDRCHLELPSATLPKLRLHRKPAAHPLLCHTIR